MDASDTKRRILRLLSTNASAAASPVGRGRGIVATMALATIAAVAVAQKPSQDSSPDKNADAAKTTQSDASNTKNAAPDANKAAEKEADDNDAYIIEPPDILTIEVGKLVPVPPHAIEKHDKLHIVVDNAIVESPINGDYPLNSNGEVVLGPVYGKVAVVGLSEDEATAVIDRHLRTILREPQVAAVTIVQRTEQYHIEGQHLVGPDGKMSLGVFGQVRVSGLTLEQAKREIEKTLLTKHFQQVSIAVDVHSYNSKVYYVIEDNDEGGDRVTRSPITGNETVLDALANNESIRIHGDTKIWIARKTKAGGQERLQVDWNALVAGEDTKTNYQLLPGDRVFVAQRKVERFRNGKDAAGH
jgi:protein involved in polysaccharide export with SLBB domain